MSKVSFLPNPFEGEHILGVVARWLLLSGETDSKVLSVLSSNAMALSTKYVHHPMVDDVIKAYGEGLKREDVLREHSLLPYYASLIPYKQLYSIKNQVKYQGCFYKHKPRVVQTSTPTTRYNSVLKYADVWRWCEQCVEEDTEHLGMPYWHVAHQLPSVARCYKHRDKTLSVKCNSCDFEVKDLRKTHLPPIDNICYACGEQIRPIKAQTSCELDWIEDASFVLLNQRGKSLSPECNHVMQRGVQNYYSYMLGGKRSRRAFIVEEKQQEFNQWLFRHGFDEFFHQPERAIKGKVLDLNAGAYQAKNWPPLSVLLWLSFIGGPWPLLDAAA